MSYLLGSAAIVGLPLGLTVLLVIVGHIAGNAVGNEGFPVVVIVLGFVFLFGLFFSIPVFLIVVGIVVVLQKHILNHLSGSAVVSPFVVTVIFIASSYWFGLHPASSHVSWLTYVQHLQIWAYSTYAFAWSAVAGKR